MNFPVYLCYNRKNCQGVIIMRIAICDDNIIELANLEKTVFNLVESNLDFQGTTIKVFHSATDLLAYEGIKTDFDLFILDIIMPDMNGIELAEEIRKKNSDCKIIFLTTSPEYAIDSYGVNAYYYLIKPFDKDKLLPVLTKALSEVGIKNEQSIVIKDRGKLTRINLDRIEYIESRKHLVDFFLLGGVKAICSGPLNRFTDILAGDQRFIQCHNSFIVNMDFIATLVGKQFIMLNKTVIPVSRKVYPEVKTAYLDYFFRKDGIPAE
jgi:DNA-binding LytR/AlgR family response regulator